ncbi:MAG TPA: TetR/AcrR family transcriptional regulator [Pseudonocardia sp.]|jgi:AcrR family transcriptional regulator|nr:TetR/AcrR family transcriptional regulator [Pseudonocardia sp.]
MPASADELTASSRVSRRRDRRKAEIMRVTLGILSTSGYQGTSLEEVAERTDIAKATIYHYFAGKDELVAAALESLTTDVLERLEHVGAGAAGAPAPEHLRILVREQLHVLNELYPEAGRLFSFPTSWPAQHSEAMKAMRRRHDAIFRAVVERGVTTGEFDCPDVDVALHCLHGILNHASVWVRASADADKLARSQEAVTAAAMRIFVS